MSNNNEKKQTPQQGQPQQPETRPMIEPKPTDLPEPNQGETVTKGG